jgi:hypothetical protein
MTVGCDLRSWGHRVAAVAGKDRAVHSRWLNGSDWSTVVTVSTAVRLLRLLWVPLGYPGCRPQQCIAETTEHFSVDVHCDGV